MLPDLDLQPVTAARAEALAAGRAPIDDQHIEYLVTRWGAEATSLRATLDELVAERARARHAAARAQPATGDGPIHRHHCAMLDRECDDLATELMHVRMALQGAREELARNRRDRARGDRRHPLLATPA